MDKDIEIMKLQIAGDSYGSPLVTSISVLFGLLVSLLILITGFAIQMGNMEAFLITEVAAVPAPFAIVILTVWWRLRSYKKAVTELDRHIKALERAESVPSLEKLLT